MITEETNLVQRAELRANGANIHEVRGLVHTYRAQIYALNLMPEDDPERALFLEALERTATSLRRIASAGLAAGRSYPREIDYERETKLK